MLIKADRRREEKTLFIKHLLLLRLKQIHHTVPKRSINRIVKLFVDPSEKVIP